MPQLFEDMPDDNRKGLEPADYERDNARLSELGFVQGTERHYVPVPVGALMAARRLEYVAARDRLSHASRSLRSPRQLPESELKKEPIYFSPNDVQPVTITGRLPLPQSDWILEFDNHRQRNNFQLIKHEVADKRKNTLRELCRIIIRSHDETRALDEHAYSSRKPQQWLADEEIYTYQATEGGPGALEAYVEASRALRHFLALR